MVSAATGLRAVDEFKTLDFVVKVAERCNIACTYCYFFFRGDDGYKEHPPFIRKDTTASFAAMLRRLAKNDGIQRVRIGLHGGEPLMTPRESLRDFCRQMRELKEDGTFEEISLSVQTNAILVDDEWIEFLSEFDIGPGVSLDGEREVNDRARLDKKGRGTYDGTVAGYRKLREAARDGKIGTPGLLSVAHPDRSGETAFRHFADDLKARSMNFLLPDFTHDDDLDPDYVEAIERFLIDVFRAWTARGDASIRVRFIDEIVGPLRYDEVAAAFHLGHGDQRHILTISSNGEVSPVDTVRTLDQRFRGLLGSDAVESVADILDHPTMQELREARANPPASCAGCDWWGICRGGTPVNRFSHADGFDNPSIYCKALKSLFLEVASWLVEQSVEISDIERRLLIARGEETMIC